MAGISSKASEFGKPQNKRGYNGNELQNKEFSDGSGLELYDFNARTYDQQLGRFIQRDPLASFGTTLSPYLYGSDNPILRNDPFGLKDTVFHGEKVHRDRDLAEVVFQPKKQTGISRSAGFYWPNYSTVEARRNERDKMKFYRGDYSGLSQQKIRQFTHFKNMDDESRQFQYVAVGTVLGPMLFEVTPYLLFGSKTGWAARVSITAADVLYQVLTKDKLSQINPVQALTSSLGPLSYAVTQNTSFDCIKLINGERPISWNEDISVRKLLVATGFNALGGSWGAQLEDEGLEWGTGAIGAVPGAWSDGVNNLIDYFNQ